MKISFNKPVFVGDELPYIEDAVTRMQISGDGYYTKLCEKWFLDNVGGEATIFVHSCTAALEIAAILCDVGQGDEVIIPSYTFVANGNAIALRGATPVFVDIDERTLNISASEIKKAITKNTKAIFITHYAGVACEMDEIKKLTDEHNLILVEDAAQAILSEYNGKKLGTFGDISCFSFHETKNIISGEGGMLVLNNSEFIERAEIIASSGTNRKRFLRGEVDKYSWEDIGSSYRPSEMIAAFLFAQLEHAVDITKKRLDIYEYYLENAKPLQEAGHIELPFVPEYCQHNAHIFYVLINSPHGRNSIAKQMKEKGVGAIFHYVPLHSSSAGEEFGRAVGEMKITDDIAGRLLRLPMYNSITKSEVDIIISRLEECF